MQELLEQLKREILPLQGYGGVIKEKHASIGVPAIDASFPGHSFPLRAVHEFIYHDPAEAAATYGFFAALVHALIHPSASVIWIQEKPLLFPHGLTRFGLDASRFIFIATPDVLERVRITEEALKCRGLQLVISELGQLSFQQSRRFQLCVEQSGITCFVARQHERNRSLPVTACISRWFITHAPGYIEDELPGVGLPSWKVNLQKVRNGKPGEWELNWLHHRLQLVYRNDQLQVLEKRQTG